MWLINVRTRQLEDFFGLEVPPYAILSHTWVHGEEVTFQEMRHPETLGPTDADVLSKLKIGWHKIDHTCQEAARTGLEYAWVDTCCIDKSSSAELSEAINSMFRWYRRAAVCYVFLSDLGDFSEPGDRARDGPGDLGCCCVKKCRWFTRSWTLQELIAPRRMLFFDKEWRFCFTKDGESEALSRITGIDVAVLRHERDLSSVSVAQKMSWAAGREATRKEDLAYSLLGIFGINMPMLYGEEERAFLRLQAEIISSCPDTTIFAWARERQDDPEDASQDPSNTYSGVMAPSPAAFRLLCKGS
ncbi:HET domain-containing protein [Diaporthe helianthi]|uniref:HET domain-containing protein n=1 Tax=Diaporthe helianthi TaxID=158607 RepID=A0A2P5I4C2_DIAHE|nr:HET domain-containing protein [Diaporthe helianthi]